MSAFPICLTLIVVVLLCYWLNVALVAIICDVSRIPKSAHTKDGSPKEKLDQYWLRPKAINSSAMDSNICEEG
jgi:hypothetical protein